MVSTEAAAAKSTKPTLKAPDFAEWSEFIGSVVLRWVARAFVAVALREIDRDILTDDEKEDLELDDESLESLSKPFAHVAMRNSFLKKHGREILDSKDAIEAAVIFVMWSGRVRRIARKYNPNPKPRRNKREQSVSSGESIPEAESPEESPGPVYRPAFGAGYN